MKDRYEGINIDYWFLRNEGYSFEAAMEALGYAYAYPEIKRELMLEPI